MTSPGFSKSLIAYVISLIRVQYLFSHTQTETPIPWHNPFLSHFSYQDRASDPTKKRTSPGGLAEVMERIRGCPNPGAWDGSHAPEYISKQASSLAGKISTGSECTSTYFHLFSIYK